MGKAFNNVETLPEFLAIIAIAFIGYLIFVFISNLSNKVIDKSRDLIIRKNKQSKKYFDTSSLSENFKHLDEIYKLLASYEKSKIELSKTIAYLGCHLAMLVINQFPIKMDRKDQIILEITFASILIHHTIEVLNANHLSDLANREFHDKLVNDIVLITLSENHSLPKKLRENFFLIFLEMHSNISNTIRFSIDEVDSLSISEMILNKIPALSANKYELNNVICEPIKAFNYSTALRIKYSFGL